MAEYGLTPNGPNIKRLDVILDDMHDNLSSKLGVNTRQNPQSVLNHILTNIADRVAELWEFGEENYFSMYPSSAEGVNLDNVAQYGGCTRETAKKSYYPIHCTGAEGTRLSAGTTISSTTNPATYLVLADARDLSRTAFNKAKIKIASLEEGDVYTVAINGTVFSYVSKSATAESILKGLADSITTSSGFSALLDAENEVLLLDSDDVTSTNSLVLSENLTTETVTTIITFGTEETGDILVPNGCITNIVKADAGLLNVINLCGYIAGRKEETDADFRKSYADKIFNRSTRMLESIRSAILENVQGVTSVAPYENPSHEWDEFGRPPHSIEIVVDGGDPAQIAQQILQNKAGGINTFGDITVIVPGEYDEDIPIRFNRPQVVHTWYHLGITLSKTTALPPNYVKLLREVILEYMDSLDAGSDVVPQEIVSKLHEACSGISYIDVKLYATTDSEPEPGEYTERSLVITARQRAYTTEEMIEVEIDG